MTQSNDSNVIDLNNLPRLSQNSNNNVIDLTVPRLPQNSQGNIDLSYLYQLISPTKIPHSIVQPDEIVSSIQLRPYQLRAIEWMLKRERGLTMNEQPLDILWKKFVTKENFVFYYNPVEGLATNSPVDDTNIRGGILADEMGIHLKELWNVYS